MHLHGPGAEESALLQKNSSILSCNIGTHGAGPALFSKLPYDHIKDFAPISLMGTNPIVLAVNPGVPAKSVKDFVAHANANSGKIVIAYGGIGTTPHMSTELFRLTTGVCRIDQVRNGEVGEGYQGRAHSAAVS